MSPAYSDNFPRQILRGQVSIGLMVNPPKPGDPSYKQFIEEKDGLLNSLKRRARRMTDAFNALEGVTCQETEGIH